MKFWFLQISQKANQILSDFCPSFLGQKSGKYLVGFLGDLKAPKIHFEISWPLEAKDQKISEGNWCVFDAPKKAMKFFL